MLKSRASRGVALTVGASLLLAVAACGTEKTSKPTATTHKVRLYGTDGNMLNTFRDHLKDQAGLLEGMKGTTPRTPLSEDFKNRLRKVRPGLVDFQYAAETYDAIVISALAAELARSTEPEQIAEQINGVTTGGQPCDSVPVCLKLARAGTDLQYRGVSLKVGGFTDAGEPATASYATLHFDGSGQLDDGKTEFVGAGSESGTTTRKPPKPAQTRPDRDSQLILGELLSQTGDLALAYPPMAAGSDLALEEINGADGVFGKPVLWIEGDDGTNPETAKKVVNRHIDAGVQVIIGAAASGISRAVLPDVTAAGLVLFSPSNTDAGLSTVDDGGLYFRSAPPDILQGRALADVILRDGPEKIVIVARDDSYGVGLQDNVRAELEQAGISADNVKLLTYEPPPPGPQAPPVDFFGGAQEIKSFQADAVLIIGFAESAAVIGALDEVGVDIEH